MFVESSIIVMVYSLEQEVELSFSSFDENPELCLIKGVSRAIGSARLLQPIPCV